MNPRILLLDDSCDLQGMAQEASPGYRVIVCLFWAAPRTRRSLGQLLGGECYALEDFVENISAWQKEAYVAMRKLCDGGPTYRGLPWRQYLSEPLYSEFLRLEVMKKALEFLVNLPSGFSKPVEVEWILSPENRKLFNLLSSTGTFAGSLLCRPHPRAKILSLTPPSQLSFWPRMIRHFRGTVFSKKWQSQIWNLVEKLDADYERRDRWHRRLATGSWDRGSVTFFSSYLNNSRILSFFQPLFSSPVQWVVTNYYARQGAGATNGSVHWIWQVGSPSVQKIPRDGQGAWASGPDGEQDIVARCVKMSRVWENWSEGPPSFLVNLTRFWESYLERVKPRMVVVANQLGIEGWLTRIARSYGIPVLQVMHGVLGGYLHTQAPMLSDALVVPGEFWRNLWPENERGKIIVYNSGYYGIPYGERSPSPKRQLTYFSWPLHMAPFYCVTELIDGFIHLFQKLLSTGRWTVFIRPHPLENPSDFLGRWRTLYGALPANLRLSKSEPLSAVLDQTDLALMFRSTVMLDCLARKIPLIMPDWIHFGWNDALRDLPGIYLAKDFSDLAGRAEDWLQNPPQMTGEVARYFIRPPGEGRAEIRSFLDARLNRPPSFDHRGCGPMEV